MSVPDAATGALLSAATVLAAAAGLAALRKRP